MTSMQWPQLLCADRLGSSRPAGAEPQRSPFQRDSDRIIFSSAFRRLQDKTQVFPLADNDYVRTRLTHSLEVASVARSLGTIVGTAIGERGELPGIHASDFGAIVSAAALAHDLGNPPFGHSGEDAIRVWFETSKVAQDARTMLKKNEQEDLARFEGNAQGFRLITRLQMPDNPGLRLTCATLGAFTKYPIESLVPDKARVHEGASTKKFGFFQSEREFFADVATRCGLIRRSPLHSWWARHPLAFLVEAADDICYRLVDFEDGFRLGYLDYEEVRDRFLSVIGDASLRERSEAMREEKERIEFLRALAIGTAVQQAAGLFLEKEDAILAGDFDAPLIDHIAAGDELETIKQRSVETIYSTTRGVEIEAAGFSVLGGLLDDFVSAVSDVARRGARHASPRSRKLLRLVPEQSLGPGKEPDGNPYQRLLRMIDFVSGMTDTYAVSLFKKIRGISLPGQ
ncbi:deoxyguanosinetriphosphate triphosphohydrolase [Chthoniobacter flavus Ellin428]|uniref:Deoxyguanosinetriphosphate triphosphohydrolase n=2 Tax=Chthoniobacter flavus TaxID=191863 RepID=B4D6K1_9BACT|nr:deoxyguanosinetriphosphate triphosphohydrolase [Chthoniobacter flavus]EDY17802.1 deoxyguanosinetriphosphate triphosphohydrolase [Chthoniobacter flavus Ellin428]TCO88414.1 dGTPase [Chthoniobacter flavus]